jgi:hypothetical protein
LQRQGGDGLEPFPVEDASADNLTLEKAKMRRQTLYLEAKLAGPPVLVDHLQQFQKPNGL